MDHGDSNSLEAFGQQPRERSGEGRWVTYDELGRIRGIGRESAGKLAQRKRWRRIPGNDGVARVCVPPDWLTPAKEPSGEHSPGHSREPSPKFVLVLSKLHEAITSVTRALERSEARADAAVTRADGLRDAITVLEAKLATAEGERERADQLVDQVEGLHRLLSDAERAARDAEDGWKAVLQHVDALERAGVRAAGRGVLARLRDALRGV
jgi:hypothetical protein